MAHVLIIDDEADICWALERLTRQYGHSASVASSAEKGLEQAARVPPDAVFLDVRLPGMSGLEALPRLKGDGRPRPVIMMTAYGELETAVEAVSLGAFEYLVKPFSLSTAESALDRALRSLTPAASPPQGSIGRAATGQEIVGRSPAMQAVFKQIALVAPSDAAVHLFGESGTGKELVARAIHRYSLRSEGPFIPVNLAALNPTLAESELFGYVRGAFTGADATRRGLLDQADGGTVFLDEVADIPPALQVKLLRALEHREVWPVGSDRPHRIDFRLISATHQDLEALVADGTFRHDLFYRLQTFQVALPPLRDRVEDIAELADHFLQGLARGGPPGRLSREAVAELSRRPWAGNVRELRNVLERAMILARGGLIGPEHFPPAGPDPEARPGDAATPAHEIRAAVRRWTAAALPPLVEGGAAHDLHQQLLAIAEPVLLEETLKACQGQALAASRLLGLHRTTLRRKADEYGLP